MTCWLATIALPVDLPSGASSLSPKMMEESVSTFETHLTAVMDSLIRASVCEITKLFQETVNDYLVELSLNKRENEALKLRLRLTENKLRTERKYGMGWAAHRRNAGLAAATEDGAGVRHKRKVEAAREYPPSTEIGPMSSNHGCLTQPCKCVRIQQHQRCSSVISFFFFILYKELFFF